MKFTADDEVLVHGRPDGPLRGTVEFVERADVRVYIPEIDESATFDESTGEFISGWDLGEHTTITPADESAQDAARRQLHTRLGAKEGVVSSRHIQNGLSIADLTRLADLLDEITSRS